MKTGSFSGVLLCLHVTSLMSSAFASALAQECINCDCCLNNACDLTSSECRTGCTNGYWGEQCSQHCPDRCKSCTRYQTNTTDHSCYSCKNGYFNKHSHTCDGTCPVECSTCIAYFNCSTCKDGFMGDMCEQCVDGKYGKDCGSSCLSFCKDNKCERSNGLCTNCSDGRYLNGTGYCLPCPDGCASCTSFNQCSSCKLGFIGALCDSVDVISDGHNCSLNKLQLCPSGTTLTSSCEAGLYGTDCSQTCPRNCQTCSSSMNCELCNSGYYNGVSSRGGSIEYNDCRYRCPVNCLSCTSYTKCTACRRGYTGNVCENCDDGHYGKDCRILCSQQCLDKQCDRDTGICLACPLGFTGEMCVRCQDGKHGLNCDLLCPSNCKNNTCGRYKPRCIDGCVNNTFYGDMCDSVCSSNCKNNICLQKTGHCRDGCINGNLQGQFCDECISGFYNSTCLFKCPTNCKDGVCTKSHGACTGQCVQGFYGDRCNVACTKCTNNTCSKYGECRFGCVQGYTGTLCSEEVGEESGTNIMSIVGIAVGAAIIILLGIVILILAKRRRMAEGSQEQDVQPEPEPLRNIYNSLNLPTDPSGRESSRYSSLHIYDEPMCLQEIANTERPVSHQYINTVL